MDIAGTGPARDALLAQVRELGLEHAVNLPGRVSQQVKSDLLSAAWLTVAPSLAEGWGLTVLEANAAGTPAVAYDVPGLRDSVRDKITGWLAPPDTGLAVALAICAGRAGRSRAAAPYCGPVPAMGRPGSRGIPAPSGWRRCCCRKSSAEGQAGPNRRQARHLATVAWWPPQDAEEIGKLLRKTLRATDVISTGADGLSVLLTGCDEVGAMKALQRVPVPPAGCGWQRRLRCYAVLATIRGDSHH